MDTGDTGKRKQTVVLLHGLMGTRVDMMRLGRTLRRNDWNVCYWTYRSWWNSIDRESARLRDRLRRLETAADVDRYHLVGHSLGAILIRAALVGFETQKLRRIVMLAPPNQGSFVATRAAPWLRWMIPFLDELSDREGSSVRKIPDADGAAGFEVGIIRARRDRVVRRQSTSLPFACFEWELDTHHALLPWHSTTQEVVHNFLLTGAFPCGSNREPAACSEEGSLPRRESSP